MNLRRIGQLWKEHGTVGLIRRGFQKLPLYISLVYCKEEPTNGCAVPGLTVERFPSGEVIDSATLGAIMEALGDGGFSHIEHLFARGCEMWLGRIDLRVAGICWSQCGEAGGEFYVRLTKSDAMVLSCIVFPEFRGRGIYPAMLENMVQEMMAHDGVERVYIDCRSSNTPSIRGILKAGFHPIGKALRLGLLNRTWILWNQCRSSRIANSG